MIDETSYASDVSDELGLTPSAHAEDVVGEVDLTNTAYGEDVAEAINEQPVGEYDLRVCQFNIGHFAMGKSPNNGTTPAWTDNTTDGYPTSTSRNYSIQLERWQKFIDALGVDIFGLPEYSARFGRHNVAGVATDVALADTGIFGGYEFSVGEIVASGGYWINTLVAKSGDDGYELTNPQDINLDKGTGVSSTPYVHVATTTIGGKSVKVAVTHLNWNQSEAYYNSRRQYEIPNLVSLFSNDDYVILFGDFNCRPMSGDEVDGLHDLDPFVTAGFTLANNLNHPLATCYATGSYPNGSDPSYPFVYIDNIIVKGFTMSNVRVLDTGVQVEGGTVDVGMLTDHCAVVADLTLID